LRVPVQLTVECQSFRSPARYRARTIDLCEGGMSIEFADSVLKESPLRLTLELPGIPQWLVIEGEVAWEGDRSQIGVRFIGMSDEHLCHLQRWLNSQLPEAEQVDPPVTCRVGHLSLGGCYLETDSPFPVGTRVILSLKTDDSLRRTEGAVRVMHPEFGMGVEFSQNTAKQREQVRRMVETLRAPEVDDAELQVEADGMETLHETQAAPAWRVDEAEDSLVELFRHKSEAPMELFLAEMRQQSRTGGAE
jgi:Tfp pilus assembly protein PilZ